MLRLNFGTSGYDVTDRDSIMEIPGSGIIPSIDGNYRLGINSQASSFVFSPEKTEIKLPGIVFPLSGKNDTVIMFWSAERKEWVGIVHNEWLESAKGSDSSYRGPFSLDGPCIQKIAEAYMIDSRKITDDEVRKTSPEELCGKHGGHGICWSEFPFPPGEEALDING